ncbi:beta-L-arabinofuranosidase domain-containing protein [Cellulomonas wangsupingiae]|uniref:beta-L-arabinofuranosidase domain-containing protein n=1 Tax=Cellulomonas wangsupingiae TaxID=2968085 RepID=UPI001D0E1B63|nr:beta-L-arabinofuranosidase domain-containing protein [Cellulomonas wangsupingiae]MCM0638506.1 glycoside hydrolase family 127 protein [Cellulomonas wangsupingiae]
MSSAAAPSAPRPSRAVTPFGPADVRLTDGPFAAAQRTALTYLLGLDTDRLLAPFRREAGLPSRAEPYGSWESIGLDGHIGGHALSAAALQWAATGDERAAAMARRLVDGLVECQDTLGTGYVGGVPRGVALWESVASGGAEAGTFDLGGAWVPWYNVHKTYAGLVDAARYAPADVAARARGAAVRLGDWGVALCERLDDAAFARMLRTEFGGMCEAYGDLAELTGDPRYATLARRFADETLLAPLRDGRDALDGLHANTQVAKVVGWPAIGETGAAAAFVDAVLTRRTLVFGGNSVSEHFTPDAAAHVTHREGPESCNTANMLELERRLYALTGDVGLLDAAERQLVNHVLSAQHPDGGFVYFTPARPGHYRVYSTRDACMWCCVGTALETYARLGELAYAHTGGDLLVNLPVPSTLHWAQRGVRARLASTYPTAAPVTDVALTVDVDAPTELAVHVRRPAWALERVELAVDGEPVPPVVEREGYATVRRTWRGGETVTWRLVAGPAAERLPGDDGWVALRWGPVALAARGDADDLVGLRADDARMGHVAHGPLRPLAATPVLVGADADLAAALRPADDGTFVLDRGDGETLVLEPLHTLHDARYTLYFPAVPDAHAVAGRRAALAAVDDEQLGLAARTVDAVACGEQQPETDHRYTGADTWTGAADGRHWRATRDRFSYRLADPQARGAVLRVTYLADPGHARVVVDGTEVGVVEVTQPAPGLRVLDLPVPPGPHEVSLVAGPTGVPTPPVVAVHLLADPA